MLYAITDSLLLPGAKLFGAVEQALQGGCRWLQYRDKSGDACKRLFETRQLLVLCNQFDARLIINDDVALAAQIGAHGVHLGQGDGDPRAARAALGPQAIIGVTCHDSLQLAQQALADSATYLAFGRFFNSSTKPEARPAPLGLLREARASFPTTDIVAIGGIDAHNAPLVLSAGANLIALCHSLFSASDIRAQAKLLNTL